MLSVSAATTTASEASPTPAPADITCAAIPRSWDDITSLLARSDLATPAATTDGTTLPDGTPADDEAVAAMERTVREWLACQNAGQQLRAWSLFSNGYLHRLLSRQGGLSAEAFAGMATPVATEGGAVLLEIDGQRVLPDGRYGATVRITYPSVPMPKTFFFYFTEEDGRLVIDGILGEISFSVP